MITDTESHAMTTEIDPAPPSDKPSDPRRSDCRTTLRKLRIFWKEAIVCLLGTIEQIGFLIITFFACLAIYKEGNLEFQRRILSSPEITKDKIDDHFKFIQSSIDDLLYLLILVELISLIKASISEEKLTTTYPIAIAITSLIREIIKPRQVSEPTMILAATVGVTILCCSVWVLDRVQQSNSTHKLSRS
ncbi:phosphate-starvation-inducible PsiE family protein [Novosphingobium sp. NDB2Meth1]|uniref:phosphate-starvation-inducible PsiE family protein n=1 Tax=Novosphingobium sp. NDB2Meth1 TaxID=1892847 RepID=UPI0009302DEF|nr:phosphate-starvation-inducible PsiE family protein [Novosphingobium sp. NDB2Meth1]